LIPLVIFLCFVFGGYGIQILLAIKGSLSSNTGGDHRSSKAFRNVTILTISSVVGFVVLALAVCLDFILPQDNIPITMVVPWVQEIAGLAMVGSVLASLSIRQPSHSTKKTSQTTSTPAKSTEQELAQPNSNLDRLRVELEAPAAKADEEENVY